MTVTLATVRGWRPEALRTAAQGIGGHLHTVVEVGDRLEHHGTPADWSGDAARAASADLGRLQTGLREIAHDASAVREAASEAATDVAAVQATLADAETYAHENGLKIARDGQVVVVVPATDPAGRTRQEEAEVTLRTRVKQIVRTATDLDTKLAAILRGVEKTSFASLLPIPTSAAAAMGTADGRISPPAPPKGGNPEANAAWWATLSSGERAALIRAHPEQIGNMNGLPAATRSRVNQDRIPGEKDRLQKQLAAERAAAKKARDGLYADVTRSGTNERAAALKYYYEQQARGERISSLEAKIRSLDTITKVMGQGDRQLLVLDTGGRRVKAAVAVGDVDTADNVAVFTPGFTTTVDGSLKGYDGDMAHLRKEADEVAMQHGGGSTAAVTWIGYEAPQSDEILQSGHSVAGSGLAENAGKSLNEFYRGIDASRPDNPHLTALGHSYGSTVTGYALRSPSGVDDTVLFGSPGAGGAHSASDLQGGHVYVIEAKRDWIADLGRFGTDPNQMKGVTNLSADGASGPGGTPLDGSTGHSEYLKQHSTSQYNIAQVVSGHPERVILGTDTTQGQKGGWGDVIRHVLEHGP